MKSDNLKAQLMKLATTDLAGAIQKAINSLEAKSENQEILLLLEGRINEIENPEKLYDLLEYSVKRSKKSTKNIESEILSFYMLQKNQIRIAFLSTLRDLKEIQTGDGSKLI